MIEFTLPALGPEMDEGDINEWLVEPGDTVTRGQVVAVVETGKANVEVECPQEGIVAEILVPRGKTVPVGAVLATLFAPDESDAPPAPAVGPAPAPAAPPGSPPARRWVSPAARRQARLFGIDIDLVRGTGAGGAVTSADVAEAASHVALPRPPADVLAGRLNNLRDDAAAALSSAQRTIPHYYLTQTMSAAALWDWLAEHDADEHRMSSTVPLVKAVALAARKYPEMNGRLIDTQFEPRGSVHVAVTIPLRHGGVLAPALLKVADKTLDQLAAELIDLVERTRTGRLRSSELTEPTITVTDLGEHGVDSVTGVIFPPQVALVGFGRIAPRPWVRDGALTVTPTLTMTLAADHRVSDGHRGALFLAEIQRLLHHPDRL